MSDFNNFLIEDINAKKELITSLPIKLKKDKIKYNERISMIANIYENYKNIITKEILKKYKRERENTASLDNSEEIKLTQDKIDNIEKYINLYNPANSYIDKLDLYKYLYVLYYYKDFTFNEINNSINEILSILDDAGIVITKNDFFYNYSVIKYMDTFITNREKNNSYSNLSSLFDELYLHDSHLVKNIYLNFRVIFFKNQSKLDKYIKLVKNSYENKLGNITYDICNEQLKDLYKELRILKKENIETVLDKAIKKEIDINNYFEISKYKNDILNDIQIVKINEDDQKQIDKFYNNLTKLSNDLKQYKAYFHVLPLINLYKQHLNPENIKENTKKATKRLFHEIQKKESKLKKYSNRIFSTFYGKNISDEGFKRINMLSTDLNRELCKLYEQYGIFSIIDKFTPHYDNPITFSNVVQLYYSFKLFKLFNIRKISNQALPLNVILNKSYKYDKIALDSTYDLINVVPIFRDYDIKSVVVIKHKLNNINISKDDLELETIDDLINRVDLLLRYKLIKDSSITAEKISTIVKMNTILKKEKLLEETN